MLANFIPATAARLTEATSIALVRDIQVASISTALSDRPIDTAYACQGSGTPILLLHGFDSSLLEFRRLAPIIATCQQAWAIDLLGFGFTARPLELTFSPTEIKTHLYYFWKTLIARPVVLVGASMGGAAAIDFALTYPDAVAKLVLIDSAGLAPAAPASKFMIPPLDRWATAFLRNSKVRDRISRAAYKDQSFASADALLCAALHLESPNWQQALIAFTKSGGYSSFANQLSQIQPPTLILWGDSDKILGTKDADKFASAIPQSQLIWIKNCGHVPHLEQPQITAQHILEFC